MLASILVAYATRYGSTQEVAEAVADKLRQSRIQVTVQPMKQVQSLERYDAVVLGAPVYIGKWHKEAHNFLARFKEAVTQRPVAIFALGPIGTDEKEIQGSRSQFEQELALYSWLKPVSLEMFVGKYDPTKLSFVHNLLTKLPASPLYNLPAADNRDWDAIRAWSGQLIETLSLPVSQ
jgi:menaquinone-dependent protoporphyrinogen oxidase